MSGTLWDFYKGQQVCISLSFVITLLLKFGLLPFGPLNMCRQSNCQFCQISFLVSPACFFQYQLISLDSLICFAVCYAVFFDFTFEHPLLYLVRFDSGCLLPAPLVFFFVQTDSVNCSGLYHYS